MFKTLRGQLVLSHILPSLVIIPIMGIALVYFLETRLILPSLENQLEDDTVVIARFARSQPQIFSDAQLSKSLLEGSELETNTRVMILNPQGVLLASSDAADEPRLNQYLDTPGVAAARQGIVTKHTDFSQTLEGDIVDVFTPVKDQENQVIGIIRLSYRYTTVQDQLLSLRYLIFGILALGATSSAILGFLLALNISNPIQQATESVMDLVRGIRAELLPEEGPSEIKILQQAVNFLVTRLRELRQNRQQLLANLVHELGRPLGGLNMSIQVLRRGAKDDPQSLDELLAGMDAEARVLRRLLDDLSHLHDQVIGTRELNFETVAVSEWLPEILLSSRETAQRKGLSWLQNVPPGLPEIRLDPQRMAQAVSNLTANAIKYTPRGGTVEVAAGESDAMVWILVHDTGPGIPVEEQAKIFEPFFRGTQKQRIKQGMGLGLNIARDYVIAHYGRIEVDSTPGLGSTFTIWLPKHQRELSVRPTSDDMPSTVKATGS
ncbi:MAG: sensor histidine kinase [Anaerolineales bacterium]